MVAETTTMLAKTKLSKANANATVRILTTQKEIEEACKILHFCFIEEPEPKWIIGDDNPSKIRIEDCDNGGKKLVDKYTDSAIWIGAFVGGTMTGCNRLIVVDCDTESNSVNEFEMVRYPSFPPEIMQQIAKQHTNYAQRIEINRLCILPEWRPMDISNALWTFNCKYALTRNACYFATVALRYDHIKYRIIRNGDDLCQFLGQFKYEETDPDVVNVYYLDENTMKHYVNNDQRKKKFKLDTNEILHEMNIILKQNPCTETLMFTSFLLLFSLFAFVVYFFHE